MHVPMHLNPNLFGCMALNPKPMMDVEYQVCRLKVRSVVREKSGPLFGALDFRGRIRRGS